MDVSKKYAEKRLPKMFLTKDEVLIGYKGTDQTTWGNVLKLDKGRAKYDLCKYYFTNRVVNAWNSLPDGSGGLKHYS